MTDIPTTRAAHLIVFCDVLREIGAPVERDLARSNLPILISEMPNELVNNCFATEFVGRCEAREGIDDLGWLASKVFTLPQFTEEILVALQSAPTLQGRISRFGQMSALEDSHLQACYILHGPDVELVCDMMLPVDLPGMNCSEWIQIAVMIEIVRSVMGPSWAPNQINFRTQFDVADDARNTFGNTRFRFRQPHTSIVMPSELLKCVAPAGIERDIEVSHPQPDHWIDVVKKLMRPYVHEGQPRLDLMAEMAGVTRRTFQRRLVSEGTNFKQVLNEVRTEIATEMLANNDLGLIDISVALGYENQSNFGRGFKRLTGVSPGQYRAMHQASSS